MAGGIWNSQNKVRPGAYINFEGQPLVDMTVGTRGTATFVMALDWGGEGNLIDVTSQSLVDGTSLALVGLSYEDSAILPIKLALQNCGLVRIFNSNTGGTQASKTIDVVAESGDGLIVTAKHPGTFGNKISIVINTVSGVSTVETYTNGYFVDRQVVSSISELVANDFVTFSGSGTLQTTASTLLVNGTNGSTIVNLYTTYFAKLKDEKWNTLAVTSTTSTDITLAKTFIQQMRDEEGKYVQAVVSNADTSVANYEGIINVVNGVVLNDNTSVAANIFTCWVAGASAGAYITDSLTGKIVEEAKTIVNNLTNAQIIEALNLGKFVLSQNQDGSIKVEKDINSLHTPYTATKSYEFSKNRVIRELDEIGSSIKNIWEKSFLGKISNNDEGRALFKSSIIAYLTELQNIGAITEFDPSTVIVERGTNIDSVLASISVKPVDSMEFLYMTVTIS